MFVELLERIGGALAAAGIPYMVIGGQAVLRYGEPRLTKDIDVTLGVDVDCLPQVLEIVRGCGFTSLVEAEPFVRETMVLPCQDPSSGVRIDLIFSFSEYERAAISRAVAVKLSSGEVRFSTLEDLIIHKVVAGRPRDLEDVRALLAKNPKVGRARIEKELAEIGQGAGEPFLERFRALLRELS